MNVREGLERMNAAWWALWGLLSAAFAIAVLINNPVKSESVAGFVALAVCVVAHRVVRWIIRGFFPVQPG